MQEHVEKMDKWFDEETGTEFDKRVEKQVEFLKKELEEGELENEDFTTGLELELYAVDENGHIQPLPGELFEDAPFAPELGLQNIELNTSPSQFSSEGFEEQRQELEQKFEDSKKVIEDEQGLSLVLDSIWTLHPESNLYLTQANEEAGYSFAENMREATRYHAIDNGMLRQSGGEIDFTVPGADHGFPSILFECLATSIQPHLQVPDTSEFADYYNLASRTMAPVLALTTNSPFLPPELYNDDLPGEELVEEAFHELRIEIFEQAVNASDDYEEKKVKFPKDIEGVENVIEQVGNDLTYAPSLREMNQDEKEEYIDEFWEWNFKRKTFWRWVRPVIGGEETDGCREKSIRIEYRPVPTQPSLKDILSVQALVTGLIHGLKISGHPLLELDWEKSRKSFYSIVRNGLDGEIWWVNENGEETADREEIFDEVFRYAAKGLEDRGLRGERIKELLQPMEVRWYKKMAPSDWKKQRVKEKLENGETLEDVIHEMQREYIQKVQEEDEFADWI